MNIALWIGAGLLAVAYLVGGGGKLILAKEKIVATSASARWADDFSAGSVQAIGALEVLAAVGTWSCPPCSISRPFWSPWLR